MLKLLMLLNFCSFYGFYATDVDSEVDDDPALKRTHVYMSRCTRRFTPGTCVDAVVSVWTYVFNTQNCTERLGCPIAYRANRFRSYGLCMRRCRPLVELYMQILAYEGQSTGDQLLSPEQQDIGSRREGVFDIDIDQNFTQTVNQEEEENERRQYINLMAGDETISSVFYRDSGHTVEEFLPPNIDYVVGGGVDDNDLLYEA